MFSPLFFSRPGRREIEAGQHKASGQTRINSPTVANLHYVIQIRHLKYRYICIYGVKGINTHIRLAHVPGESRPKRGGGERQALSCYHTAPSTSQTSKKEMEGMEEVEHRCWDIHTEHIHGLLLCTIASIAPPLTFHLLVPFSP